jgi:DNA-binding NarL/FixJ family response regulator
MEKRIRIILADDHPVVRRGLSQFFADHEDLQVVAECDNGASALAAFRAHGADVLIVDLSMPGMSGIDVLRELKTVENAPPVILLAGTIGDQDVIEAFRLGVRGVVLKEMAPNLLVQCVRKVFAGGMWLEKESIGRAFEKLLRDQDALSEVRGILTPREIDVVREIVRGLSNRAIAEKLFISEGTVKTHLHGVFEKLGIRSRLQLARYGEEHGIR